MKIAFFSIFVLLFIFACEGGDNPKLNIEIEIPAMKVEKLNISNAKLKVIDSQNRAIIERDIIRAFQGEALKFQFSEADGLNRNETYRIVSQISTNSETVTVNQLVGDPISGKTRAAIYFESPAKTNVERGTLFLVNSKDRIQGASIDVTEAFSGKRLDLEFKDRLGADLLLDPNETYRVICQLEIRQPGPVSHFEELIKDNVSFPRPGKYFFRLEMLLQTTMDKNGTTVNPKLHVAQYQHEHRS
jgi:hypothetical protein